MMEKEMYLSGKNIYEISEIIGISPVGVWKRLKKQGVQMRTGGPVKGTHWAIEKRGEEFLGADGRVWIRGINSTKKRNSKRRAVVVMEEILGKPIPKGYFVHHKDKDITNDTPNNLELKLSGEHTKLHHLGKKNLKKGHSGSSHPKAKLSEEEVLEIRRLYSSGKYTQKELANKFKVHQTDISHIVTRRTWGDLT